SISMPQSGHVVSLITMEVTLPQLQAAKADDYSGSVGLPHGLLSVRRLNPRAQNDKMGPVHIRLEKPPMLIFKGIVGKDLQRKPLFERQPESTRAAGFGPLHSIGTGPILKEFLNQTVP